MLWYAQTWRYDTSLWAQVSCCKIHKPKGMIHHSGLVSCCEIHKPGDMIHHPQAQVSCCEINLEAWYITLGSSHAVRYTNLKVLQILWNRSMIVSFHARKITQVVVFVIIAKLAHSFLQPRYFHVSIRNYLEFLLVEVTVLGTEVQVGFLTWCMD